MAANIIFPENITSHPGISDVVVDTNVFIDILDGQSYHQQNAVDLISNLTSSNINMYITQTIQHELMDIIQRVYTQDLAIQYNISIGNYKGNQGFKKLQKELEIRCPNYFQTVAANRDAAMSDILSMVDVLENPTDYCTRVMTLQKQFNGCVEVSDTGIVLTAFEYGINTIATGDFGYSKINGINVIPIKKGGYKNHVGSSILIPFKP
ncbi:PIN domain-containing protein [Clostridiaceae bacterium HFYG-1003]|nr:PIN domain-containing protein [Clostridiaceae bacterium HFYG-1003]UUM12471.1 PIN domain-containing protein [Clostridiaceae bacterium HFYG-1003]